jgi:hypothetical protein
MRSSAPHDTETAVNTQLGMLRILELLEPCLGHERFERSRTNLANLVRTSDTGIHSKQNRRFVFDTLDEMEKLGYVETTQNAVGKRYSLTKEGEARLQELRADEPLLATRNDLNTQKSRGIGRVRIGATEERQGISL